MGAGIGVRAQPQFVGKCKRCHRDNVALKARRSICYRCVRESQSNAKVYAARRSATACPRTKERPPEYADSACGVELRTMRPTFEEEEAERARRVEIYREQLERFGQIFYGLCALGAVPELPPAFEEEDTDDGE